MILETGRRFLVKAPAVFSDRRSGDPEIDDQTSVRRGVEAYGHYQAQGDSNWRALGEQENVEKPTVGAGNWNPESEASKEAPNTRTKTRQTPGRIGSLLKARETGTLKTAVSREAPDTMSKSAATVSLQRAREIGTPKTIVE